MCKIERPNLGNMVYEFRKIEHRYRGKKCNCAIVTKKNVYCWSKQENMTRRRENGS